MDRVRIHLDTAQYVRGVPTFMAFAEDAPGPPEQKPLPIMDPDEQVRLERCEQLNEMNRMLWAAWEEWKSKGDGE